MDYDRHDALLHWLFRQTQGDAWFRPTEENISSGVALRISDGDSSLPFPLPSHHTSQSHSESDAGTRRQSIAGRTSNSDGDSPSPHPLSRPLSHGGHADSPVTTGSRLPEFRIFPYETPSLEPFENAVVALNPLVAVKVRSAAVHAALADWETKLRVGGNGGGSRSNASSRLNLPAGGGNSNPVSPTISHPLSTPTLGNGKPPHLYIDSATLIQVLPTMSALPYAQREQGAAFIRDERVLVVWSERLERIVGMCRDLEERLIRMLWRTGGAGTGPSGGEFGYLGGGGSTSGSMVGLGLGGVAGRPSGSVTGSVLSGEGSRAPWSLHDSTTHDPSGLPLVHNQPTAKAVAKAKKEKEKEKRALTHRPTILLAPLYNGLAALLALLFIGNGLRVLIMEYRLDGNATRFALLSVTPLLFCVSLFFTLSLVQNLGMMIGPVKQCTQNSRYYSAFRPPPLPSRSSPSPPSTLHPGDDSERMTMVSLSEPLPHITIQMPVYKESLDAVLAPSILSIKRAMKTYARQGGSSAIFVCDDGMRLLNKEERERRMRFYREMDVGWVARPKHTWTGKKVKRKVGKDGEVQGEIGGKDGERGEEDEGFRRKGRFKKASNLNYGLALSVMMERHLEILLAQQSRTVGSGGHGFGHVQGQAQALGHTQGFTAGGARGSGHGFGAFGGGGGRASVGSISDIHYVPRHLGGGDEGDSVVWGNAASTTGTPGPLAPPPLPLSSSEREPSSPSHADITGGYASLEDKALALAIDEMWAESGRKEGYRPWACNGRSVRIGEVILLVDSDTVVPVDCLRDGGREVMACEYEDEMEVAEAEAEAAAQAEVEVNGEVDVEEGKKAKAAKKMIRNKKKREVKGKVAIVQHESDVLSVVGHWFENGIAYFTKRVNKCISFSCANGEIAPFMGHNAFLRWKALQEVAFVDPEDGKVKIWSESNVSEDFDMALRLMLRGWDVRWATYSRGGFKEGVSLSVDDELNRWQKYAYGCNELLFNPIKDWWKRGPINSQIHRFLWSPAPLHYKLSMLSYMFSYYGIAGSITVSLINYVLLGFQFDVDGYFMHSFEIFLATTVVFWGSGTVGYTLLEYRVGAGIGGKGEGGEEGEGEDEKMDELDERDEKYVLASEKRGTKGKKGLVGLFWENVVWIPFFFFFFGGLSIPLTQAILAHLFSYDIQWGATIKEVEASHFFKEIPKIVRRFWFPLLVSFLIIAGMIIVSTPVVPSDWRVEGKDAWAVIVPLSMSVGCHVLFPIVLNPWLMVFSY